MNAIKVKENELSVDKKKLVKQILIIASVVVEWTDNEMYIVEDNCCTNNVLSTEHESYDPDWDCWRYQKLKKKLDEKNSTLTEDETMQLMSDVSFSDTPDHGTQWSCVYDLDDFTFSICTKRNYDDPHKFGREDSD